MEIDRDFFEIINSKYGDREIPSFDEKGWKSMKTKIDASRRDKKRTVWLMVSVALLLSVGGVGAFYQLNNGSGKSTSNTHKSDNTKSEMIVNNGSQNTGPLSSQAKVSDSKIASNNKQLSNENIVKKESVSNQLITKQTVADNNYIYHKSLKRNGHNSNIGKQVVVNNVPSNDIMQNNTPANNDQGNIVAAGSNSQQNNIVPVVGQNNLTTDQKESVSAPTVMQKAYPVSSSGIANALAAKNISDKADSAKAAEELPKRFGAASDEPRIFRGKTNIFSIEGGGEYSFGWAEYNSGSQNGSVVQGKGINEFIGVGYAHYLGSKLFLKTGLQVSTFNNMNTVPYNYQHSIGNVVYDSAITTKSLYFLRIPVQLEYSIGNQKRSSIGIGGSVWFLLGNSGFATTYQQIDNNPPVNVVQHSQSASLNEYSKVNASFHLLYKYTFTHNLSAYGIWYFEATNMKNNSFFGDGIIHRTNGPQVAVSYSF